MTTPRPSTAPPTLLSLGTSSGLTRSRALQGQRVSSKLFVVAVDGTRMSKRALRLAAWLMDTGTRDKIKCVCVSDGKDINRMTALDHVKEGEKDLMDLGLGRYTAPGEVLFVHDGGNVVDTLNKVASGGHLVMGTSGEKRAGKGKATNDPALVGSVSLQCMATCSAPVILCKPKGTPALDSTKGMQMRGQGVSGTKIVVSVDGSKISQKCFDMSLRFVKPADMIHVVHVQNSDQNMLRPGASNSLLGNSAIDTYYSQECAKAEHRFPRSRFVYQALPIQKASVVETILAYTESVLADMIIMGSVELGKASSLSKGLALGSVSAAIARRTPAHVLIAKNFAL